MTYALIALNALTLIGAYVWLQKERGCWAGLLADAARERQGLLDRIQAPDRAPFELPEPDDRDHYVSERQVFLEELEAMEGPS